MPKNTKVHKLYTKLLRQGKSKSAAARIAQAQTGMSLKTGKTPAVKSRRTRRTAGMKKKNK